MPPTRADAPLIRIKVLTCLFPVQELCGPSRKRASEDSGGFTAIPPSHDLHTERPRIILSSVIGGNLSV